MPAGDANSLDEMPRKQMPNGVDAEDGVDYTARSRSKHDIFHKFDALHLQKNSPVRPALYSLLIFATFIMVDEDHKRVMDILQRKGITNFDEHHFYNWEVSMHTYAYTNYFATYS